VTNDGVACENAAMMENVRIKVNDFMV